MATSTLTKTTIDGSLGDVLVDVRTADRKTSAPAVLVVHGFKGFKDWGMFPSLAERLAKAGFGVVSFNLSGSGVDDEGEFTQVDRFGHNTFSAEQVDLDRVLEALDDGQLGIPRPTSVGILGHSRGGGAAILFAARTTRIGSLVTWAAISTVRRWSDVQRRDWRTNGRIDVTNARTGQVIPLFTDVLDDVETLGDSELDLAAAAARLTIPWLLVHGTADDAVPIEEAHDLLRSANRSRRLERLIVIQGKHTFGATHPFAGMTPDLEQVFDATTRFFGETLA